MPRARITRTSISKLEYPGHQVDYYDTKLTGFGVRVNALSKTYFVHCRVKGTGAKVKESLGRCDVVDYDKALDAAGVILENAANGIAPADIARQAADMEAGKVADAVEEAKKDITLADMFKSLVAARKNLKESTIQLYTEDIDRYLANWKETPLRSITGQMVIDRHTEIGELSKSRADGAMRILRAIFNHAIAMHEDIFIRNPVAKLSAVNGWYRVPRKTSYIKPGELKAWLPAVLELAYDTTIDFVLMMLFQGSRRDETAKLTWGDVDLDGSMLVFRETKTGVPLHVPMSGYIKQRLGARQAYYDNGPDSFVFPSYGKTGRIRSVKHALTAVFCKTGTNATHHDLRRTFLTYCEEIEIPMTTRKRLVNHAIPSDITEAYTSYNPAKLREAVEKVAAFILANAGMVEKESPLNVIPITRRRVGQK
jgi:integrase